MASSDLGKGLSDDSLKRLFLFPTLLLLISFNLFPLLYSLILSFTEYSSLSDNPPRGVGLKNYSKILTEDTYHQAFVFTAKFVSLAVGCELILGFGLALLLNRKLPGKGILVTCLLIPMMLSPAVVAKFWTLIYDPSIGPLNFFINYLFYYLNEWFPFGAQPLAQWLQIDTNEMTVAWLQTPPMALLSLLIVDVWQWTPFMMLISLAGLSAIPKDLYEAAQMDRASSWFQFRRITFPLVLPLLILAIVFRALDCFKVFDSVHVLTAGGPGSATTTAIEKLYLMEPFQRTSETCSFSYIMLVVTIGLTNIALVIMDKVKEGEKPP